MIENYGFYTNKIAQQNIDNSFIPTNRNLQIKRVLYESCNFVGIFI